MLVMAEKDQMIMELQETVQVRGINICNLKYFSGRRLVGTLVGGDW